MTTDKNNFGGKEDMTKEVEKFSKKYGLRALFEDFISSPESQTTLRTHHERVIQEAVHLIDEAPEKLKEALAPLKKEISGYSLEAYTDLFISMMEVELYKASKILPDAMRVLFECEVDEEKENDSFIEFIQTFLGSKNSLLDLDSMLKNMDDEFMEFVSHEIVSRVIEHTIPDPVMTLAKALSDLGIGIGVGILVPVDSDEEDSDK